MRGLTAAALLGLSLAAAACGPLPQGFLLGPASSGSQATGQSAGKPAESVAADPGNQNSGHQTSGDQGSGNQTHGQHHGGSQTADATASEQPQGATVIPVINL